MSNIQIAFVGMPGAGKTFFAHELSQLTAIDALDLDVLFEKKYFLTPKEVILTKGERAFRKMETELLKETLASYSNEHYLLSLGGGTPCFDNNMEVLLQQCKVVYLWASIDFMFQQLQQLVQHRPLLKNLNYSDYQQMWLERHAYFCRAHITIASFQHTIKDLKNYLECTKLLPSLGPF